MTAIHLDAVGKTYGSKVVLRNLSLTVENGECFTLLGPSGCGKTVLLRLIAGFETPESGSIHVGGTLVADGKGKSIPPDRRDLGVVFQDYAVWPHMTVAANVGYPLKLAKLPAEAIQRRVRDAVGLVSMQGLEDRLPSELSGGQQQRVALARALVANPSLMLLDEPLSNLDANLREEMRFEIRELQNKLGITVLYVTHDQEIALAISDRMAIMDKSGKIRQIGTPVEIYENPADLFVFTFMGVANIMTVREKGETLVVGHGTQPVPWAPPEGDAPEWVAGFRPSDVILSRPGAAFAPVSESGPARSPLTGRIRRASFLGAMTDYLIEIDGVEVRTEVDTLHSLNNELMFAEGEECFVSFHSLRWFDARGMAEVAV